MNDERVGEGIAKMLNQQGPQPSNNDLKDKIYKIRERHSEEMQKLELQLGKTTTEYLELSERVVNLARERDELRNQKAVLESQLAESKERCDELRIAWKVTKEQLAAHRSLLVRCNSFLSVAPMSYPYNDQSHELRVSISAKLTIDAAGALRAKPEATPDRS